MFKRLRDARAMVAAAPDMIEQSQRLAAQAQAMVAAQQAATQVSANQRFATGGPDFEPIAGVSLQQYARISRQFTTTGGDLAQAAQVAASNGVSAADWQAAFNGWNARIKANPAVSQQFATFTRGVDHGHVQRPPEDAPAVTGNAGEHRSGRDDE
jgi:hypothetical protein